MQQLRQYGTHVPGLRISLGDQQRVVRSDIVHEYAVLDDNRTLFLRDRLRFARIPPDGVQLHTYEATGQGHFTVSAHEKER